MDETNPANPTPHSPDVQTEEDDDESTPLGTLLTGIGSLGFAGYLFYYFTQFEAGEAAAKSMWWVLAVMYNTAGKWPPVGLLVIIGLACIAFGVKDMLKSSS